MYAIYTPEQRVYNVLLCELGGQIIQFTPEDDEIDRKCTFWEGGKVANIFWMWYQMIQRQYLDFEGGVKQFPLESYKISIIMYGWEGYGWEWIIRGGGGISFHDQK